MSRKSGQKKGVLLGVGVVALTAALTGCADHKLKAPKDAGVCFFIGHPKEGGVKFNPIAKNDPDLEHCAVHLYNLRMGMVLTGTAGAETAGSYQGNFLFVTNREVRYSQHYEGATFPLLTKAPDGRLVQPGSIVEEPDAPSGPQTVNVPKDLPTKP